MDSIRRGAGNLDGLGSTDLGEANGGLKVLRLGLQGDPGDRVYWICGCRHPDPVQN